MAAEDVASRLRTLKEELEALNGEIERLKRDERACKRNFDLVLSSAYCPVCLQPLSLEYKHEYSEKVAGILKGIARRLQEATSRQRVLEEEIRSLEVALKSGG